MYLFDISRDILTATVYKGDPKPMYRNINQLKDGDSYNLSMVEFCTHTGTHIDAPSHFLEDGKTIDQIRLSKFYGACTVVTIEGVLTGEDMEQLLPYCKKKILFHSDGKAFLSQSAVYVLCDYGADLIGTDGVSVAFPKEEVAVHRELLMNQIVILEGLNLEGIKDGNYTISAFPIKLAGLEAAPCRAVLFQQEKGI